MHACDPVLVKEFLGHRTLDTTLLYIQLERALFKEVSNDFIVKATKDIEEVHGLLEVGFEYVCEKDGSIFFRKRKWMLNAENEPVNMIYNS